MGVRDARERDTRTPGGYIVECNGMVEECIDRGCREIKCVE